MLVKTPLIMQNQHLDVNNHDHYVTCDIQKSNLIIKQKMPMIPFHQLLHQSAKVNELLNSMLHR